MHYNPTTSPARRTRARVGVLIFSLGTRTGEFQREGLSSEAWPTTLGCFVGMSVASQDECGCERNGDKKLLFLSDAPIPPPQSPSSPGTSHLQPGSVMSPRQPFQHQELADNPQPITDCSIPGKCKRSKQIRIQEEHEAISTQFSKPLPVLRRPNALGNECMQPEMKNCNKRIDLRH